MVGGETSWTNFSPHRRGIPSLNPDFRELVRIAESEEIMYKFHNIPCNRDNIFLKDSLSVVWKGMPCKKVKATPHKTCAVLPLCDLWVFWQMYEFFKQAPGGKSLSVYFFLVCSDLFACSQRISRLRSIAKSIPFRMPLPSKSPSRLLLIDPDWISHFWSITRSAAVSFPSVFTSPATPTVITALSEVIDPNSMSSSQ